jgi:hypothetical protein
MTEETYRYRLTFKLSKKGVVNVNEDDDPTSCQLSLSGEGAHTVTLDSCKGAFKDTDEFQLSQGGYSTAEEAWDMAKADGLALAILATQLDFGVDFAGITTDAYSAERAAPGSVTFSDGLFPDLETKRTQVIPQKLGITVVPQPAADYAFFSLGMIADLIQEPVTPYGLFNAWSKVSEQKCEITEKDALALELFNSSYFENSPRTQFLILIQMLETLAERANRPKNIISTLDEILKDLKAEKLRSQKRPDDAENIGRIISSIGGLKKESITQAITRLAEGLCGEGKFGQLTSSEFVQKCYKIRGSLTHSGSTDISDAQLLSIIRGLRQLCRLALKARIGFQDISIPEIWIAPPNILGGIEIS